MGKTVVILGAALAGLPLAHYLVKHTTSKIQGLKVILVSPNSDFFWNLATPRAILPDQMPDSKIFFPIAEQFSKYPSDQFEFVVAKAEALDPATNTVTVSTGRRITYDTLVIATGAASRENMPFKNLDSTEETKASLQSWRQRIAAASSIVVAGAGTTGVELAGELGEEYAKMGRKQVTLIADKELPLYDGLNHDVRETALKELQKLKVRVITNTKVTGIREAGPNGKKMLELANSTMDKKDTLMADVFIPTYGVSPNTDFLPRNMVDARGFVKQNTYLRAEGHDNIFAIGDVGNLQAPQAKATDDQVNHLVKSLESYLAGGQPLEYKPDNKVMLGISIGKNRATGQLGNWRPWSIMMWYFKGRYLGTDYAASLAAGERTVQNKNW